MESILTAGRRFIRNLMMRKQTMAVKTSPIAFHYSITSYQFRVWADLSDEDYAGVEGIVSVGVLEPNHSRLIEYDPRYDGQDIREELQALADAQEGAVAQSVG